MNAPKPTNDICASETWPMNPLSSTSDKQMQIVMTDDSNAARSDP
jgi:hypothetical protein